MGMLLVGSMISLDIAQVSDVTIFVVVVVLFLIALVILVIMKHWFIFDWTTIVAIRVSLAERTLLVMSVDSGTIYVCIFTNLAWFQIGCGHGGDGAGVHSKE